MDLLKVIKTKFIEILRSPRMGIALQYLVFVAMSLLFWIFMTLNKSVQEDLQIPFELTHVPDSVTIISNVPQTINVTVRDKGASLLKYKYGKMTHLKFDFRDYSDGENLFKISTTQLNARVRQLFKNEASVSSVLPDSVLLKFTNLPGKRVPIRMDVVVEPDLMYELTGRITCSHDSAMVYGTKEALAEITEVYTFHVEERYLTDSLHRNVSIAPLKDVRIEPKSVQIEAPIEPLVRKAETVLIKVRNAPENVNVLTFPTTTKISYLIPRSMKANKNVVTVTVNYNDILNDPDSPKVPVRLGEAPAICKDILIETDSVEYIIEKHAILHD